MKTRVGINGACGRMGQRLVQLAYEDKELHLVAALEAAGHPCAGRDAGEVAGIGKVDVPIAAELPLGCHPNVIIDFSSPEGTRQILPVCVERLIPLVVATTGHAKE